MRSNHSGALPVVDRLNPNRAPAWLRPILYVLFGLMIAFVVFFAALRSLRRRTLQALTPGAAEATVVPLTPVVGVRAIFRRFWPYIRPYRGRLLLMLLLVPIPPAVAIAEVILFKRLIDDVLVPHDFDAFPALATAFVGLGLLGGVVSFTDEYLSTLIGERFVLDLRTTLFRHVQGLSLDFFERRRLGDLLARLTGDTVAIEELLLSGVASALSYALRIAFFAGALFYLRWDLALVSLAVAPVFLVVARHFARLRKAAAREKRRRGGAMSAVVEESLSKVQVVQAFNRQETEVARFRAESLGSFTAQMAAARLRGFYGPLVELIELTGVLLILGIGTWELSQGWLSIGGLLAFLALLSQLYRPIRSLGRLGNTVAGASAGAERVVELLDQRPTVTERPGARTIERAEGVVEFGSVGFRYPETAGDAVSDISFIVAPGETLALVGPSGAGKSTIAKLLLRFYDPTVGAVCLDGVDVRDLKLHSLRDQVAAVFQETLVFDATIAENIAYGLPGASRKEIVAAAEQAALLPFVSKLPQEFETVVGENGRRLSGGQRQRIAIARAYLRKSPVLVLDEPTTGLDADAASRVLEPLRRLAADKTTILISHDLSLVRDATLILALDHGRIAESGTHGDLVDDDGLYNSLSRPAKRGMQAVGV
jgi:ATP-binding cassette, subfamily B, bacterial